MNGWRLQRVREIRCLEAQSHSDTGKIAKLGDDGEVKRSTDARELDWLNRRSLVGRRNDGS
jgi:hypothetical protein